MATRIGRDRIGLASVTSHRHRTRRTDRTPGSRRRCYREWPVRCKAYCDRMRSLYILECEAANGSFRDTINQYIQDMVAGIRGDRKCLITSAAYRYIARR